MITPQAVLFIVGIVSLVLAVVLAIVAATYFVRQDIRAVMDDLSGKARQQGAGARGGRRVASRKRKSASAQQGGNVPSGLGVRDAEALSASRREDELETALDTKLRKVPYSVPDVSFNGSGISSDMSGIEGAAGRYHKAETNMQEADRMATEVEDARGKASGTFVVTRSIISINSSEVITAG